MPSWGSRPARLVTQPIAGPLLFAVLPFGVLCTAVLPETLDHPIALSALRVIPLAAGYFLGAYQLRDQQIGGDLLWGFGEVIDLPFLVLLLVQWVRSDTRDARQIDARPARPSRRRRRPGRLVSRSMTGRGGRRMPRSSATALTSTANSPKADFARGCRSGAVTGRS